MAIFEIVFITLFVLYELYVFLKLLFIHFNWLLLVANEMNEYYCCSIYKFKKKRHNNNFKDDHVYHHKPCQIASLVVNLFTVIFPPSLRIFRYS